MLTDKHRLFYCGLFSIALHLCFSTALTNNWLMWERQVTSQPSTIQISLIHAKNLPQKKQKKIQSATIRKTPQVDPSPAPPKAVPLPRLEPTKEILQTEMDKAPQSPAAPSTSLIAEPTPEQPPSEIPQEDKVQVTEVINKNKSGRIDSKKTDQGTTGRITENQKGKESETVTQHTLEQRIEPSYLVSIRQEIEKHLNYPARARRLQIKGKVNLRFIISADGDINESPIHAESPYSILNKAAIHAVKKAAPFPRPRHTINIELPILFSLN